MGVRYETDAVKVCRKCNKGKPRSEFHRNKRYIDSLARWCKACVSKQAKANYRKRGPEHVANVNRSRDKTRRRNQRIVCEHLLENPCEIRGEKDILALDFDHIEPGSKDLEISYAVHGGWSESRLRKEMSKCRILCANCHRRETALQNGRNYRLLFLKSQK